MNFAPFAVATTNIFPCANSTAGGQLLSEFNLRARESVATPEQVKYMIGPSYVHSQDDFTVSLLKDDLGNTLGSNTVFVINEGKGVINGHFVQSLVPIQIDLAVANQYLAERNRPQLKGKLKVGLRVMYSTESTMAGAMLKENEKYYEGVHVVVLPESEFHLPTDEGYGGIDKQSYVTAHLWLADISFVNGRLSEVIKQNVHKCEMLPASRISDVEGMLAGEFLKEPRANAGKLYVYSGKVTEKTDSGDISKAGWCEAQNSLMLWDADSTASMNSEDYESFIRGLPENREEAYFASTQEGEVHLVIPHKQVDGIRRTSGEVKFYPPRHVKLPVADYAMETPGTVDKEFIQNIKSINTRFDEFWVQSVGQQKAYVPTLSSVDELPPVNKNWNIGDYILVGQDSTVLVEEDASTPPSTLYFVTPGYVTAISEDPQSAPLPDGVQLGKIETTHSDVEEEMEFFELGNIADGYNYRGIKDQDYFVRVIAPEIPSIEYNLDEEVTNRWYTERRASSGNYVMIAEHGYIENGIEDEGCLHLAQNVLDYLSENVSASINLTKKFVLVGHCSLCYKMSHLSETDVKLNICLGNKILEVILPYSRDWRFIEVELPAPDGQTFEPGSVLSLVVPKDQCASLYIDNLSIECKPSDVTVTTQALNDVSSTPVFATNVGHFYNYRKRIEYYYVTETGNALYSSAVMLTGTIRTATESTIGGFYNVPDTYMDAGYVRLNEHGNLVLNDYALLRSGVLAYQLGENFETSAGLAVSSIQEELNNYVNQRVAFPNANHIQSAENVNVIDVTVNLSEETEPAILNIYDIDSRFNTCVYLHIRGTAGGTTTINISDISKLRLDIEDTCGCVVNISRCNLYYAAHILDRLNYIADMDLWYERFSSADEWLQITGRTVTQISGPVGWVSEDHYNGEANSPEDIHYAYALRSLTFSSSGNIIGVDMAIKNELSHIGEDSNEYLHVSNFRIPQASGFTYPESRLNNKIKISGRFISVPAVNNTSVGVSIVETDFVAVTNTYRDDVLDNGINGTITFLTKVHTIDNVAGLGAAQELTGWASGDYHVFHGEVAYESNT